MRQLLTNAARLAFFVVACRALTSCGTKSGGDFITGPATYELGGTVTGLTGTLVLKDTGFVKGSSGGVTEIMAESVTVTANGSFDFGRTQYPTGASYFLYVKTQPAGQSCAVANASGTVDSSTVTNVAVTCATVYTVGATVSGLTGTGLVLQLNGASNLAVTANGAVTFGTTVVQGLPYAVTVLTQPSGQICTVANGIGTNVSANVTNVTVTCAASYTIGATVSGLTGTGLVLQDNGASNLAVAANGSVTFGTALTTGATYGVTVLTQPTGQTCTVANGSGTVGATNVTTVTVTCAATRYTISATVSGLTGTGLVLQDDTTSNLTVTGNGLVTFATGLVTGAPYSVTVLTQPSGQSCVVTNGIGTVAAANITSVVVTCVASVTEFLYGANDAGSVSAYAINSTTGALTALTGSPFASEAPVFKEGWLAANPIGNDLYFAQPGQAIQGWSANATTGVLTPIAGAPFANTGTNGPFAINPSGSLAYAPLNNSISAYTIGNGGALTGPGALFAISNTPAVTMAVTPNGQFAYVANPGPGGTSTLSEYSVNSTTGALTALAGNLSIATDSIAPNSQIIISPNGQSLYISVALLAATVGGTVGTGVDAFAINPTTGALSVAVGSPFASAAALTSAAPYRIAMSPNGQFLYVPVDPGAATAGIRAFAIINQTTGGATEVTGSPFTSGVGVNAVVIDVSGQFLYAANSLVGGGTAGLAAYAINQTTGALTQITGSPFASSTQTSSSIYYMMILK